MAISVLLSLLLWFTPALLAADTSETQPPEQSAIASENDPSKGDPKARITIIEFSDYQCPYCARHVRETLPQIERDYIKTGKARYFFRDFPVESIHPNAAKTHEAAHCAGEQKRYWAMHDLLFANQKAVSRADLSNHAKHLGLEVTNFGQCLDSGKHRPTVMRGIAAGLKAGVTGTPTFVLVLTEPRGNGPRAARGMKGAVPYNKFKDAIEILLSPSLK